MRTISISKLLEQYGIPNSRIGATLAVLTHPNPNAHNPDPEYLNCLLMQARLSPDSVADLIGITVDELQEHLRQGCPYPVQYCLEVLAQLARH